MMNKKFPKFKKKEGEEEEEERASYNEGVSEKAHQHSPSAYLPPCVGEIYPEHFTACERSTLMHWRMSCQHDSQHTEHPLHICILSVFAIAILIPAPSMKCFQTGFMFLKILFQHFQTIVDAFIALSKT